VSANSIEVSFCFRGATGQCSQSFASQTTMKNISSDWHVEKRCHPRVFHCM